MGDNGRIVEPEYVILCDDVRQENNGKIFIIGMYPSNISIYKMPCIVQLSMLISFTPLKLGSADARIKLNNTNTGKDIMYHIRLDVTERSLRDSQVAAFTGIPMQIEGNGTLEVYFQYEDNGWELLKKYDVVQRPVHDAAGREMPLDP